MTSPHDPQDGWLPTPNGRLFVRVWTFVSHRAPIILFHDSLGSVELWRSLPVTLSVETGRTVIAYDRLGFGKSDARQGPLPLDFVGAEAAVTLPLLFDALDIDDFVAMGHSVGGGMAIHSAAAFPVDCCALITESAQAFVEARTLDGIRAAKADFQKPGQRDRLVKYHGDKAQWVLDAWTETWLAPEFQAWTLDEVLPQVTCPMLAIHGEDDEYGSPDHAERIASTVAGEASAVVLPGRKHIPHRQDEDAIVNLIVAFLEDVD